MQFSLHRWISISLFNLLLVASIGVVLRYKIAFALPFINQKHLLHGHSHFAFAGWISQVLMVLLVGYLAERTGKDMIKRYRRILFANLVTAYGMLIAFTLEGYGSFSIIFSLLSVFVSYVFAVMYWNDLDKSEPNVSHLWFKAALLFNAVSSLGAFALAGMMIRKIIQQHWYLAAEYFYLHFQYNGWFFFACMGLFIGKIIKSSIGETRSKKIFQLFTLAFVPAYFLSVLWMDLPVWIYVIIVAAAFAQVLAWGWLLKSLRTKSFFPAKAFPPAARLLLKLSALALSIKLLLQLGSVIPALSDLSYGFRPIIIGYLHLVLLGVITLFILGYLVAEEHIVISRATLTGLTIFTAGIIINEILLMIHGVTSLNYNIIPFINEILFVAALVMFAGLAVLNISRQIKSQK